MQSYFQSYYVNTYLKYYFLLGWKETDPVELLCSYLWPSRWRQRNKDQGFLPVPPYVYPHANHYASAGEASQYHETPFGAKPHYLFVIRQLLHYTVPHLHAEHEASRVHQNNVCRERYHLPAIFSHPHWDTGYQWTSTAHKTLPKTKSIFNFCFFQIAWSGLGLRQLLFL